MNLERSVPAVRAALIEHAPERGEQFDDELQQALTQANDTLEPGLLDAVLDRWWGTAAILANPLTEHKRVQLDWAKVGDFTGMLMGRENGTWVAL